MRFEQFVERYDGLEPYDIHLHLQVPHISNKYTGRARRVDEIYSTDSNNTIKNWDSVVSWYGKSLPEDGVYNARSKPRRFKTSLVSTTTKQKICRISAIDYCCLNIELPTECRDMGIHCSLDQNKHGELQIQPWQHPNEIDWRVNQYTVWYFTMFMLLNQQQRETPADWFETSHDWYDPYDMIHCSKPARQEPFTQSADGQLPCHSPIDC